jgi:hypothetical protein
MGYDRDRFIKDIAVAHATLGSIRDSLLDLEDYLYSIESTHQRMIGEQPTSDNWLGDLFSDIYAEEEATNPLCNCDYCRCDRITAPDYRMD